MDYEKTHAAGRDGRKALELAAQAFTNSGFRISSFTDNRLEVEGPKVRCTRESALRGVSKAVVTSSGNSVSLSAEFGTHQQFILTMAAFIVGLGVAIALTFMVVSPAMTAGHPDAPRRKFLIGMTTAPLLPWIFLLPLFKRSSRRRLERELDTLLNNMAMVAG